MTTKNQDSHDNLSWHSDDAQQTPPNAALRTATLVRSRRSRSNVRRRVLRGDHCLFLSRWRVVTCPQLTGIGAAPASIAKAASEWMRPGWDQAHSTVAATIGPTPGWRAARAARSGRCPGWPCFVLARLLGQGLDASPAAPTAPADHRLRVGCPTVSASVPPSGPDRVQRVRLGTVAPVRVRDGPARPPSPRGWPDGGPGQRRGRRSPRSPTPAGPRARRRTRPVGRSRPGWPRR